MPYKLIINIGKNSFLGLFCFILLGITNETSAQTGFIKGKITSKIGPVTGATIQIKELQKGTYSDTLGQFLLKASPGQYTLSFSHIEYHTLNENLKISAGDTVLISVFMTENIRVLDQVDILDESQGKKRTQASSLAVDPQAASLIPGAFRDFNNVLKTLPGVTSNNELSSQFTVRGGNFDENLVYVNDLEIYRPQLVRAGRQEGLSFVNPDLVNQVTFSSGGWESKYGDKLSSVLNVNYKKPQSLEGSLNVGLLGGSGYYGNQFQNGKISMIAGVRHKRAGYLFSNFELKGQYFPTYTDFQSYITFEFGNETDNTGNSELGILLAHADNNYLFKPESRVTNFGTQQKSLRLAVDFEGREVMDYNTSQGGFKFTHHFNSNFKAKFLGSGVYSREREYFDVEAGYRLCDIKLSPNDKGPNECISIVGSGTNYRHARNRLDVKIFNFESRFFYSLNNLNTLEWGVGYAKEDISDYLEEYSFEDSAGFVSIKETINNQLNLNSNRFTGYVQNTSNLGNHTFTYGVRVNHWDVNKEWLASPRIQYAYKPSWEKDILFRASTGWYQQPPFYKELRTREGRLNKNVKAQKSIHGIAGFDYRFEFAGRPFKLLSEVYYKYLDQVNPYNVDNLRINYFAKNNATAYAIGIDTQLHGEFIEGAESWFSLGILSTREKIEGDGRGYIRRPSDQRVNLGIFFQDHLPNVPSLKAHLNFVYGSGLPFGPPENEHFRNAFNGSSYKRVDLGFSKHLQFNEENKKNLPFFSSIWIGLEVLNLLGADNTISYTWVEDVNNNHFAVPNGLSARFLNLNIKANY